MTDVLDALWRAAQLIREADGLIITAGAGMGVDSGLPDFRGAQGFWGAYPALGRARIPFESIASPHHFEADPALAWGFYGHRLKLYRETVPHAGFAILKQLADRTPEGAFVFTSNVDGQFQKAGFAAGGIVEIHGSIHYLQCQYGCMNELWSAGGFKPEVDEAECRLLNSPPRCPHCRAIARPNILMFSDGGWHPERTEAQRWAFEIWRANVKRPVVIELGAGIQIPTVRRFGEQQRCPLVRINKTAHQVTGAKDIGIPLGAEEAMREIAACLQMF